ncbi:NAD-dependent epimerase/dehydratase family protein [Candidatus Uabimicrobium sp. HlEnr_7]|uniref:NAD-dependent epimerase/dehydratase family protein n=1 Tax=Candidatus Uabimicrobium helgolandensis TaxID=3095367 RepID=UPI003558241F
MNILILGGNRFFGKKLAKLLVEDNHQVTLLNRGKTDDNLGDKVSRIKCDRNNFEEMQTKLGETTWDIVFDQICYTYIHAQQATQLFNGKAKKYIHTSTVSVYDYGADIKEEYFQPKTHQFSVTATDHTKEYKQAKRQAETAFSRYANFPTTFVRIPVVIGSDDYTKRFEFHLKRIKDNNPIYFPNIKARKSFITSDDAAKALYFLGKSEFTGAINVASPKPLSLQRLVEIIEKKYNKKATLAQQEQGDSHSPYGIENDWFINTDLLHSLGLKLCDIEKWLIDFS